MLKSTEKTILKAIKQDVITFVILFLFLWLTFLPLWGKLDIFPNFFALIYFHWLLYRPDLLGLLPLIVLSFIRDGLLGNWIGISLIHFLTLYCMVYRLRQFFVYQSFLFVFFAALGFVAVDSFLSWFLLSYQLGSWISYNSFGGGALLVFCFYPVVTLISTFIQKRYLPLS